MTTTQTNHRPFGTFAPIQTQHLDARTQIQSYSRNDQIGRIHDIDVNDQPPLPLEQPYPTHDQIAQRAYHIYVASGRAQGRCEQNWLQAEEQLTAAPQTSAPDFDS